MKRASKYFAIILPIVAIITVVFTTVTWYSHNKEVKANDVKMKVTVSPNLVIADAIDGSTGIHEKKITDANPFEVTFSKPLPKRMAPATHDEKYTIGTSCDASHTGLKYITNAEIVDETTGLPANINDLLYKSVPVYNSADTDAKRYYFDYPVYLACVGTDSNNRKLTATVTLAASTTATLYQACSVDFIVDGKYAGTASPTTSGTPTFIYTGDIPNNLKSLAINDKTYIEVILRCYFDGALVNSNKAYVNTVDATQATSTKYLNVTFNSIPAEGV